MGQRHTAETHRGPVGFLCLCLWCLLFTCLPPPASELNRVTVASTCLLPALARGTVLARDPTAFIPRFASRPRAAPSLLQVAAV